MEWTSSRDHTVPLSAGSQFVGGFLTQAIDPTTRPSRQRARNSAPDKRLPTSGHTITDHWKHQDRNTWFVESAPVIIQEVPSTLQRSPSIIGRKQSQINLQLHQSSWSIGLNQSQTNLQLHQSPSVIGRNQNPTNPDKRLSTSGHTVVDHRKHQDRNTRSAGSTLVIVQEIPPTLQLLPPTTGRNQGQTNPDKRLSTSGHTTVDHRKHQDRNTWSVGSTLAIVRRTPSTLQFLPSTNGGNQGQTDPNKQLSTSGHTAVDHRIHQDRNTWFVGPTLAVGQETPSTLQPLQSTTGRNRSQTNPDKRLSTSGYTIVDHWKHQDRNTWSAGSVPAIVQRTPSTFQRSPPTTGRNQTQTDLQLHRPQLGPSTTPTNTQRTPSNPPTWGKHGCISCRRAPTNGVTVFCKPCHDKVLRMAPMIVEVPEDHERYKSGQWIKENSSNFRRNN